MFNQNSMASLEEDIQPFFKEIIPSDHRIYHGTVASCIDRAAEQAERTGIHFVDYLRIADLTEGRQGKHKVEYDGRFYRVHIKGKAITPKGEFGIVRAVIPCENHKKE